MWLIGVLFGFMREKIYSVAVVLLFVVVLVLAWDNFRLRERKSPVLGEIFFLNKEEIEVLKKQAIEGEWVAAALLNRHYGPYLQDIDESRKWRRVAEENKAKMKRGQ